MNSENRLININIDLSEGNRPRFLGSTGIHQYSVNSKERDGELFIEVNKENREITLYKLHFDLAIFLTNEPDDSLVESHFESYAVYGNLKKINLVKKRTEDIHGYGNAGYLDKQDVKKLSEFLSLNNFSEKDSVREYYDNLIDPVKLRLEELLDDRIVDELHFYLKDMTEFYKEAAESNKEIIVIFNN